MRDFKYHELLSCPPTWNLVGPVAKNGYLIPPFRIFESALARTQSLAAMPMMVACHATLHQLFLSNANFWETGRGAISINELLLLNFPEKIGSSIRQESASMSARPQKEHDTVSATIGIRHIEAELKSSEGMRSSMDAIFTSIILQSWTAFESLAADLWVAAVDNGPERLCRLVINSGSLKKSDESITPKDLFDLQYDARTHLGSFLRDTRRVSFQSLKEISKTYGIGFEKKGAEIFLKTNSGEIFLLAAFRNVFAHRNGSIDKDFTTQVKDFPEFVTWCPPDIIKLDGQLVGRLRDAATQMGFVLVSFLDQYITALTK